MIHALLIAALSQPCGGDLNQADLDECWMHQAEAAQASLDRASAKLKAQLERFGIDATPFVAAQNAWASAREKTCDFEQSLEEGGSIAPMMYSECQARMTQARTVRVKRFAAALESSGEAPELDAVSPRAQNELARVYGLLLKQDLSAAAHSKLVSAERAWTAYRDDACAVEGGACLTELAKERTAELEAGWLGEPFW